MGSLIEKGTVISRFISRVITPARNAIQFDRNAHPRTSGSVSGGVGGFPQGMINSGSHALTPNSFNNINPAGGRITASDLAIVFQHYAYNLSSIRRASIRRYRNYNGGSVAWEAISTNRITSLNPAYRIARTTFNARVTAAPNPMANLQPGDPAASSAINALIDRLAAILSSRRSEAAITVNTCHNSCHSNCHGSRGRR